MEYIPMNILLINDNPVVSRLLALCTRDDEKVLEEVVVTDDIECTSYDFVFIDEGSYKGSVLRLDDSLTIGKKILLSNADVEINDFDLTIKKPFLPSQILEVFEDFKDVVMTDTLVEDEVVEEDLDESVSEVPKYEPKNEVLDSREVEKIKELLDMDDIEDEEGVLSDEDYEERKIEVIKEQLIAEGLEIVGEDEIVEALSEQSGEADEISIFSNDERMDVKDMKSKSKSKNKHKSEKKKKKKVTFTQEELEQIEDAIQVAMGSLKRKQMKKLLKGKEISVTIKLEDDD